MIRQATTKDIPHILELYKAGLEEIGYTDWQDNLLMKKVTESFVTAPCFLVEFNGKVLGMAGLCLVVTSHSGVATLMDYMFYVDKSVRNIKTLSGLMKEIKQFAIEHNFPVRLNFTCNDSDEKLKRKLLEKYGFKVRFVTGGYNDT